MSRAKRWKKLVVPPPEPPRDPRLVALAEQAQRAGWVVEWRREWRQAHHDELRWWLGLRHDTVGVEVFVESSGALSCRAQYLGHWNWLARTPTEALRQAYGALGVALDQAEDAFVQVQEQGEVK